MLHCVNHILLLLWAKTWVNRQRIVSQSFIYIIFIMIQKNYSCFNLSLCYSQACGNWVTFGKQIYKTNRSDFLNELVQAESKFIFLMMSSLIFFIYSLTSYILPILTPLVEILILIAFPIYFIEQSVSTARVTNIPGLPRTEWVPEMWNSQC